MGSLRLLDEAIFNVVNAAEAEIESKLNCNVIYFYGEIRPYVVDIFRNIIEQLAHGSEKKETLSVCLTTPGGQAEVVEKLVEIVRYHYCRVYFIVPDAALSAGTIFCMSGDRIYMDYSSSLGPIDPQVPDKEDKYLVPALGYLDKVEELVEKSRQNTISPAEIGILLKQDLAMLRFYEQARDLSVALLKKWLATYKFKDWTTHRTTSPGSPVTSAEKEARAQEIATRLSDNKTWHSHGRLIGMKTLRETLRLDVDDYGEDPELQAQIRTYSDTLSDYLRRHGLHFYLHSRHVTS